MIYNLDGFRPLLAIKYCHSAPLAVSTLWASCVSPIGPLWDTQKAHTDGLVGHLGVLGIRESLGRLFSRIYRAIIPLD